MREMRVIFRLSRLAVLFAVLFIAIEVAAQTDFKIQPESSEIKVEGTSTVHDWHMLATEPTSTFKTNAQNDQSIIVESLSFKVKAEKIVSDNSMMDGKAHDALKSDDYPDITFTSLPNLVLTKENDQYKANAKGKLEIAGFTKEVTIPVTVKAIEDDHLIVNGSISLNFGDFKMKAPTALMGAIKAGETITVSFNLNYKNINGES